MSFFPRMQAVIDFETRSQVDIKRGPYRYAEDPSTSVLCIAYKLNDEGTHLWHPGKEDLPHRLFGVINSGGEIHAHNAGFERAIWEKVCVDRMGWPPVNPKQWRCSAARSAYMTLPRSLEKAGAALNLDVQKDTEGARIMRRLCKPQKPTKKRPGIWVNDKELFQRLYAYCKDDVNTEHELENHVLQLPEFELKIWQLDQEINARGLKVDIATVKQYLYQIEKYREELRAELEELTQGRVQTVKQNAKMLEELQSRGLSIQDLQAGTVAAFLELPDIPWVARRILELRQLLGAASVAKLQAMKDRMCSDGRVRDNLVYFGATTGRWAGSGLQIQNFFRPELSPEQIDMARELLTTAPDAMRTIIGDPIYCAKNSLRSMVIAEKKKKLFVCDYASIEARVTAWVANEQGLLQEFHDGADVYKSMASDIYDVPRDQITKDQRHIGKQAILGLGYAMGWLRFYEERRREGIDIDRAFSRDVVKAFRKKYSNIRAFWNILHDNFTMAFLNQEMRQVNGLWIAGYKDWITIQLPSGRHLFYFKPQVKWVQPVWATWHRGDIRWGGTEDQLLGNGVEWKERDGDWFTGCTFKNAGFVKRNVSMISNYSPPKQAEPVPDITYMKATKRGLERVHRVHGGLLTENVVQAISRDFLAEAMLRVDPEYPIVATVHDEIVSEADEDLSLERFEDMMCEIPPWGMGCPIKVEGYKSDRYKK